MSDYDGSFDYLLGNSLSSEEGYLEQLSDVMLAEGIDISQLSEDELSSLLHECGAGIAPDLAESNSDHPPDAHDHEVRFGAGTCSHCGGRGYTTWPSSGSQEPCWYCSGSSIAH